MSIVGERPETGVRIVLTRERDAAPEGPWAYEGEAALPDAAFPLRVTVTPAGDVDVDVGPPVAETGGPAPADLAERVRLIVRTVHRQAVADEEPPPWRIVRWRADKK